MAFGLEVLTNLKCTTIGLDTSKIPKKILTETLSQTVDMLERKLVIENKT